MESSFGIPVPIKDLGVGFSVPYGVFSIDLVIFQLYFTSARNVDSGTLINLDGFLNRGAAFLGGHHFLVGVNQVVVIFHPKDSLICGFDLEITIRGGDSEAGLSEVGF